MKLIRNVVLILAAAAFAVFVLRPAVLDGWEDFRAWVAVSGYERGTSKDVEGVVQVPRIGLAVPVGGGDAAASRVADGVLRVPDRWREGIRKLQHGDLITLKENGGADLYRVIWHGESGSAGALVQSMSADPENLALVGGECRLTESEGETGSMLVDGVLIRARKAGPEALTAVLARDGAEPLPWWQNVLLCGAPFAVLAVLLVLLLSPLMKLRVRS